MILFDAKRWESHIQELAQWLACILEGPSAECYVQEDGGYQIGQNNNAWLRRQDGSRYQLTLRYENGRATALAGVMAGWLDAVIISVH